MNLKKMNLAFGLVGGGFLALAALCDAHGDALSDGFAKPPRSARPHTWYHMMNGNVTKEGITRDFEELAKAGVGGVQMFDAGCDVPSGDVAFNSPAWFDTLRHAATEARRLGLEICVPNCSGWSSSGGPWNPPSNGMKRVTYRLASATGPGRVSLRLPRETNDRGFYADVGVFAFPTPAAELEKFDGVKATLTPEGDGFTLASDKPFEAMGFLYYLDYGWGWIADAEIALEISDDGVAFHPFGTFRTTLARSGSADRGERFHSFPKKTAMKALRAKITHAGVKGTKFRDVRPSLGCRISNLSAKTFTLRKEAETDATATTPDQVIPKDAVRDVTDCLKADGTFEWTAPAGEWTILRFGYLCSGQRNHPASKFGGGLEVDKLSAEALDYHFEQYAARLCRELGPLAGDVKSGLNNILVDSYEVGSQNWTQKMEEEFLRRRGYSIRPFLPAFAGFIINDVPTTERFLEDFRRVVADLFAENYSGALAKKCHQYGLKLSLEPYGNCPADNLQYGEYVDIPMAEFWSNASYPYGTGCGNSRFVSSVAHVWGKRFCGSESFTAAPDKGTGRWLTTPFSIKAQGDSAYANGVNRIIYHRFVHQPWTDARYQPGMTMGRWGMHFDRTQTWWEFVPAWLTYQARCQFMLQRGTFQADVLFFVGEEAPNQGGNTDGQPGVASFFSLPDGHAFDVCPTDAMYRLKVDKQGRVVVPGGTRYRLLVMPNVEAVSPEMMTQVLKLRSKGASVAWARKPVRAPGLKWGKEGDLKVRKLADDLWAKGVLERSPAEALASLGVAPDVKIEKTAANVKVGWIHRADAKADWYFVAMPNREVTTATISFRQTGRIPELWDAETATCAPAERWFVRDGRTHVEIPFTVCGSKFVVFRRTASDGETPAAMPPPHPKAASAAQGVEGAWTVKFPHGFLPNRLAKGAEETVVFDRLVSWSEHANEGVRYFSGIATYEKSIPWASIDAVRRTGGRIVLDLGTVKHFAEVTANGKTYPVLWKPPFRTDVTDAVAEGKPLELRIRVANLWANRLIGDDRQFADDCEWVGEVKGGIKEIGIKEIPQWVKDGKPSPTGRSTFTTWKHWDKNDELQPSGIFGPVFLRTAD